MVSFQCDGCSDVIKKPKLDQHRLRCNASFSCIDCSKTFPTPADWKGHTSCITEAEKYQKSLYKPKNNHDRGRNAHVQGRGDGNFNNSKNASWNRGTPRSQATGANDTPLGTPIRMSPLNTTENEAKPSTPNVDVQKAETSKSTSAQKRKADEVSPDKSSAEVKEETKSNKKRKSDTKEPDHSTAGAGTGAPREVNSEDNADADKKKKKKKKEKKIDEIDGNDENDLKAIAGKDSKVKEKKEKKHKGVPREEESADTIVQMEDKANQEEHPKIGTEKDEKKKKSKSAKKEDLKQGGDDENVKPGDVLDVKKEEKKKKKKSDKDGQDDTEKKRKSTEEEKTDTKLDEPSAAKAKNEKSKKRKHAENSEGTSEKGEVVADKKKRKKD